MKSLYEQFAPIYTWANIKKHEKSDEHKVHVLEARQLCEHVKRHIEKTSWGNYITVCDSCSATVDDGCNHKPVMMETSSGNEDVYCENCNEYIGE